MLPEKLQRKLEKRKVDNALRQLSGASQLVDFSSNDYLGFSKSKAIAQDADRLLSDYNIEQIGATGSRLLSGNHGLYHLTEQYLSEFHNSEAALIFNSGYNANVGFFSCVPQRGDVILYDELIHASIRDGIALSHAKSHKFKHNDIAHLETLLERTEADTIYVVTESVFSMDGDTPDLAKMNKICQINGAFLVVDEAHAIGVFGLRGEGLIQQLKLEEACFARIVTYGKALGCHGAAILGSTSLIQYLINFSRSFIYTTALPPHSIAAINSAYSTMTKTAKRDELFHNIQFFKSEIITNRLQSIFIESSSAIHSCIIPNNNQVKAVAQKLNLNGFNVKPILSPTVPKALERLRFCLHAYNTEAEISKVLNALATFVSV